ncbi:hypothetical protein EES44_17005 [Streptomyces sp. ADI96-15]|nr:hypothetical protein EES44_17005 [Streptomyces sp. ADI96-15]
MDLQRGLGTRTGPGQGDADLGGALVQKQRFAVADVADRDRCVPVDLSGSGCGELDVRGAREDDGALHLVVVEIGVACPVDGPLPRACPRRSGDGCTQQRVGVGGGLGKAHLLLVFRRCTVGGCRLRILLDPVLDTLPRVVGQGNEAASAGDLLPVESDIRGVKLGHRGEERLPLVVVPPQGADGSARLPVILSCGSDRGGQNGVGADLYEDGVSRVQLRTHGVDEVDWLADVASPVLGVQLGAVDRFAEQGGVQRDGARLRAQVLQLAQQVCADSVHLRPVGGVVHVDPAVEHVLRVKAGQNLFQRLAVPGQQSGCGAVRSRDSHGVLVARDGFARLLGGQFHPGHGAVAAQAPGHPAPAADHRARVRERQRTADIGGGRLAHGVSDHDVGLHSPGTPQLGQSDLHSPQGGLDDVHPGESFAVVAVQQLDHRPAVLVADHAVAGLHGLLEHRLRTQELAAHADPLRSLAGEDENDAGAFLLHVVSRSRTVRFTLLRELPQSGRSFAARGHSHRQSAVEVAASQQGAVAEVTQGRRGRALVVQNVGPGAGQLRQRLRADGRQGDQMPP